MEENKDNTEGEVLASSAEDKYFPNLGVNIYPPVRMLLNNDDVVAENEDGTMGPPNLALWALTARTDSLKLNQATAASIAEVEAGVITNKYISPATTPRVNPASIAEVEAGTINNKYVSPATLPKVNPASAAEVAAGTVPNKYVSPATLPKVSPASAAEVTAGTVTDKYVSPATLPKASVGGAPEYYKIGVVYSGDDSGGGSAVDSDEQTTFLGGRNIGFFLLQENSNGFYQALYQASQVSKPDWVKLTPYEGSPFSSLRVGGYMDKIIPGNILLRGKTADNTRKVVNGALGYMSIGGTRFTYIADGSYGIGYAFSNTWPLQGVLLKIVSSFGLNTGNGTVSLDTSGYSRIPFEDMRLGTTKIPPRGTDLSNNDIIFGYMEFAKLA